MAKLNPHFSKLADHYLFPEIEKRIACHREKEPNLKLLDLGVGDISEPLPSSAVEALCLASKEMGEKGKFRGYGPPEGYLFLREAIAQHEYAGMNIDPSEIFISDGAQADMANFQEIFDIDNRIAITDPTYPVYLDSNVIAGRTRTLLKTGRYGGVAYLPCLEENKFQPLPPKTQVDLIYLCTPNNPTGVAMDRTLLKSWIDYAKQNQAVILIDGAYSAFVTDPNAAKSIYEIEGAKDVAVEFRSFSKSAGFTGLRCSYSVVPKELKIFDCGKTHYIHALWKRRHDTKFNGVAYPIQKAAAALFTPHGQKEMKDLVSSYLERAHFFLEGKRLLDFL
ncbi:MAG: LL-diaminopimelate aminotransferase, partial [Chlamydiae bacterium]|nr:LL-diaminopimelate aminotransferase [Chlamydiota bacterium]